MKVISDFNKIDKNKWNDFVSNHQSGNVFHTPEMVEVYNSSPDDSPLAIACFDDHDQIVGLVVADIKKEVNGFMAKFTSRTIVWGGPLIASDNQEVLSFLLKELNKKCKHFAIYTQIRNLNDTSLFKTIFVRNGFKYEDHLDILIDLKKGEDKIWNELHPTRRKQINRGIKRGVNTIIKDNLTENELEKCHSILSEVYNDIKLPFPSLKYFEEALYTLGKAGYFKAILALYEDKIIGFRFVLVNKKTIYDWYAASLSDHYDKYPNDILPWEIMKWGVKNNYKIFDFGGAGKPGIPYGVRDYKLKFGGVTVNYGRYTILFKPFIYLTGSFALKTWQLIRKK